MCPLHSPCTVRWAGDKNSIRDRELQSSLLVTSSLKDHILNQDREYGHNIITDQLQKKATINRLNRGRSVREADDLYSQLPDSLQRAVNLAKEKGASTWLTVLPLTDHGFALHKSMMPWPCDMAGPHPNCPPNVIVATVLQ